MTGRPELWVVRCGQVPYGYAREAQKALEGARHAGDVPDLLLLLEHPPVYTKGRRSTAEELPMGEHWYRMQGIDVVTTDRGGRVTYHGPGQLVAYPIMSLAPLRDDVHEYVRRLERVMISALGDWGVQARTIEGLTGVWTHGTRPDEPSLNGDGVARKIGSIGVHVNRAITTHGVAVNVSNDLQPFEWIVPCGIESCRMTSLTRELGEEQSVDEFGATVRDRFAEVYERTAVDVNAARLAELVDGVGALSGAEPAPVR
jgi:lipoyl(octanoyl) transferase